MSNPSKEKLEKRVDEKVQQAEDRIRKSEEREEKMQHLFRHGLHILERIIAVITLAVLLVALGNLVVQLILKPSSATDLHSFLHDMLNIVVGLEFVRMLIDTTPASIMEVLTVAITRHVILNHDEPISNLISVACIAGLFATRRYFFRRGELKQEMVEKE